MQFFSGHYCFPELPIIKTGVGVIRRPLCSHRHELWRVGIDQPEEGGIADRQTGRWHGSETIGSSLGVDVTDASVIPSSIEGGGGLRGESTVWNRPFQEVGRALRRERSQRGSRQTPGVIAGEAGAKVIIQHNAG